MAGRRRVNRRRSARSFRGRARRTHRKNVRGPLRGGRRL